MKNKIVAVLAVALVPLMVWASEPTVCTLSTRFTLPDAGVQQNDTTLDGGAIGDGGYYASDAGSGTCSWQKGATVLMQCDVNILADTTNPGGSSNIPIVTSSDQFYAFGTNTDPVILYLDPQDKVISIAEADGGQGTCKFMTSKRRKPW